VLGLRFGEVNNEICLPLISSCLGQMLNDNFAGALDL
jgi:hypothetical protein